MSDISVLLLGRWEPLGKDCPIVSGRAVRKESEMGKMRCHGRVLKAHMLFDGQTQVLDECLRGGENGEERDRSRDRGMGGKWDPE